MKTMLITGTTQGIGKEIFDYYKNKYHVVTINRRLFEGENYICDLASIDEVVNILDTIKKLEVDILINNAGGAEPVLFENLSVEDLVRCTNLNYHAPILLMQSVLGGMQDRKYGRIVNISSIASKSPRPLIAHYGAAKSALEKFSSSMAVAYGNNGISINCICPGGVCTESSIKNRKQMAAISGLEENFYNDRMANGNGLGRMVEPIEVVRFIDYLLSDAAGAISGQVYNICGTKEVH